MNLQLPRWFDRLRRKNRLQRRPVMYFRLSELFPRISEDLCERARYTFSTTTHFYYFKRRKVLFYRWENHKSNTTKFRISIFFTRSESTQNSDARRGFALVSQLNEAKQHECALFSLRNGCKIAPCHNNQQSTIKRLKKQTQTVPIHVK